MVYLWRAVDHEGDVLESYVTTNRDKAAGLAFMKKALKRHGVPEAITLTAFAPTVRQGTSWATEEARGRPLGY